MIWWFLLIWLAPIVLYTLVAWLILPKGSTLENLIDAFESPLQYNYLPPLIFILIPFTGLLSIPISIIWFISEVISKKTSISNIRIK